MISEKTRCVELKIWRTVFCLLLCVIALETKAQDETIWIPAGLTDDGEEILLQTFVAKPDSPCPYPVLIFNHGSAGNAAPESVRRTFYPEAFAEVFTDRGWLVLFPQRRGRGGSGGDYAEGLNARGGGYSCETDQSLRGMERALEDIDFVMRHVEARPDADLSRIVIGGQSRGGILAVVYAGTRDTPVAGVLNFVGGWINDRCWNATPINTESFIRGAEFSENTLWLYGLNDQFYGIGHSRTNFEAFIEAGGQGEMLEFSLPDNRNGHALILYNDLWGSAVDGYFKEIEK